MKCCRPLLEPVTVADNVSPVSELRVMASMDAKDGGREPAFGKRGPTVFYPGRTEVDFTVVDGAGNEAHPCTVAVGTPHMIISSSSFTNRATHRDLRCVCLRCWVENAPRIPG